MLPFAPWRDTFIGDAAKDLARRAYDRPSPTPYQPFADPVDCSALYDPAGPPRS